MGCVTDLLHHVKCWNVLFFIIIVYYDFHKNIFSIDVRNISCCYKSEYYNRFWKIMWLTLKTGVMIQKINLWNHINNYILQSTKISPLVLVSRRDFFENIFFKYLIIPKVWPVVYIIILMNWLLKQCRLQKQINSFICGHNSFLVKSHKKCI